MKRVAPKDLLRAWLERQLPDGAQAWLDHAVRGLEARTRDREFYLAISLVPRQIGKDDLHLAEADLAAADRARPGWRPHLWSVDQAARVLLLLSAWGQKGDHRRWLDQLCITGDVGELIAFYRGLPLYPDQPSHLARALEGARTNMKVVFEAVAHNNPYPAENFDQNAWNHLVLKALFIGSALDPIQHLDERANPELMRMLCDYANERRAAGRDVPPELWRCVAPFADEWALKDLGRLIECGTPEEQEAAALALGACSDTGARTLLAKRGDLIEGIETGRITWRTLSRPDP